MKNIKSRKGKNIKIQLVNNNIIEGEIVGYSTDDVVIIKEKINNVEAFVPVKSIVSFSFPIPITSSSFIDIRDKKEYKTVTLGKQIWMAKDLAYRPSEYTESTKSNEKNVVLYNRESAKDACPVGWHIPSTLEWYYLLTFISGEEIESVKDSRQKILSSEKGIKSGFNANSKDNWWDSDFLSIYSDVPKSKIKEEKFLAIRCVKNN